MKRRGILWVLIAVLLFVYPTYAAGSLRYVDFDSLYDWREAEDVSTALETGLFAAEGAKDPYKLYPVLKDWFFELHENTDAKLKELNDYLWLIPLKDGANRKVRNIDGAWQAIGGRMASIKPSQEDIDMKAAFEQLNKEAAVTETDPGDLTIYAVEVMDLATSFLICVTPREVFAIPYSDASHLTNLESGKLYTLKNIIQILQKENTQALPGDAQANSGSATFSEKKIASPTVYILVSAGIILLGALAHRAFRRKRIRT